MLKGLAFIIRREDITTEQTPNQGITFLKGCLIAVAILVIVLAYIIIGEVVFGLQHPWVGLLALTAWGGLYANNIADVHKVFIGSTVAILIGAGLWWVPSLNRPSWRNNTFNFNYFDTRWFSCR